MPRYKLLYLPSQEKIPLREEIECLEDRNPNLLLTLEEAYEEKTDGYYGESEIWYSVILDREFIEDAVADGMKLIRKFIKDKEPVFYKISFREDKGSLIAVKTNKLPTGGSLHQVARVNTTDPNYSYWEVYLPYVSNFPLMDIIGHGYNLIQTTISDLKENSYHGGN